MGCIVCQIWFYAKPGKYASNITCFADVHENNGRGRYDTSIEIMILNNPG